MSGYASYDDALDPKYGDPFPVPLVVANEETLKGYGKIVTDFEKEEVEITVWPQKGWRPICEGKKMEIQGRYISIYNYIFFQLCYGIPMLFIKNLMSWKLGRI